MTSAALFPAKPNVAAPTTPWAAFLAGLLRTSWTGTILALVTCAAVFGTCLVCITPARFMRDPARFMADREDSYPFLKASAMRLARMPQPKNVYRVVIIGDSALREALTKADDLKRRIETLTPQKVEVDYLVAGGLTKIDAVELCGIVRGHVRGQVILQVSPFWLAEPLDADTFNKVISRVGLETPDLSDEFAHAGLARPMWSRNFFLRNYKFMFARTDCIFRLCRALPEPPLHVAHKDRPHGQLRFDHDAANAFRIERYLAHGAPQSIGVYRRMISKLEQAGTKVTLLEAPLNPALLHLPGNRGYSDDFLLRYQYERRLLSRSVKADVWELFTRAHLRSTDFSDGFHIERDSARERFTNGIAQNIATTIDTHNVTHVHPPATTQAGS